MKCFRFWSELTDGEKAQVRERFPHLGHAGLWWRWGKFGWEYTRYR